MVVVVQGNHQEAAAWELKVVLSQRVPQQRLK
jgi:hypothetical protein